MGFQVFNFDAAGALKFEDAAGADDGVEREIFQAAAIFHEVNWTVHVRAGVGGHGEVGDVAGRAVDADLGDEMDFDGGVAKPVDHAVNDREGDVDPVGG